MKAITNTKIVLLDSIIFNGTILIDQGKIVDFGEAKDVEIPPQAEIIDAMGLYSGPGLIDIHSHAGDGKWFHEDAQKAADHHLKHGTTTLLPALYNNLTLEDYIAGIQHIKKESQTGSARIIYGLYMEGPYLNPKYGCETDNNKWASGIDKELYTPLIKEAGDFAKVWCIAPELENMDMFVDDVCAAIPNIILSVAHSEASPEQIFRYLPRGLNLATHHTNATGDLHKYPEVRGVCVDEAVNFCDDIYAELICDSMGIHVDPFMLRLVVKIKGKDRIILISDNFAADGPVPDGYAGVTDINFDSNGEIAGSKLTLDVACQNMMKHTGAGICDVFRFASYNPSRLLGLRDRGCFQRGSRADIVIVSDIFEVNKTLLAGDII
ncbi:MAG: amidohydrolase family protein [Clostridiaceae bacterium]|jgi:N-acetylglucosamine-6-phosphate deacetylase|nr:amidohydrolase family protein [Clostridiaceae bacterium]